MTRRCVAIALIVTAMIAAPAPAYADQPNTRAQVTHSSPLGKTLTGRISSPTDHDWFRFDLPRAGRFLARLTYLPANLRLDVLDAHGNAVSRSTRPWRQFEEIYRHFDARTYYLRVSSQNGTYDAHRSYHLRFSYLAPGVRVLTTSHWRVGYGNVTFACDMVNNTPNWQIFLTVKVELVDRSGYAYADSDSGTIPDVVRPYGHSICTADFRVRDLHRLHHVRVTPEYQRTTWRNWPISVRPGRSSPDPTYGTVFRGRLRNDGSTRLHQPDMNLMLYGPAGRVRALEINFTRRHWLAPGATMKYFVASRRAGPHAFFLAHTFAEGTPPHV